MRDKNLWQLFLVLNVALAACFIVYLVLSSNRHPQVTATSFQTTQVEAESPEYDDEGGQMLLTNPAPTELSGGEGQQGSATNTGTAVSKLLAEPVFSQREFGWEQLQSDEKQKTNTYKLYLDSLRAVGCPENKVRYIVLADINELFSKKRLKEAVAHDLEWWRSKPQRSVADALQQKGLTLEEERRALIEKYLGPDAVEEDSGEAMLWSSVQLTGPVLGNLPADTHNAVQELCSRAIERSQNAFWSRINNGQQLNQVEMARLRERTRADLRKVLDSERMLEFLLRYSHNANQLRQELSGLEPTPDEFREIMRVTDAMDHQLQLEYGTLASLSPQQRERHVAQRERAIEQVLGPKRFQEYLRIKDPLYRKAQMTAQQYGAPPKAIMPLYEMTKVTEGKRQEILKNTALTSEQKKAALSKIDMERAQSVQRIVQEARRFR